MIHFEAIDCNSLVYNSKKSNWFCKDTCCTLKNPDTCMRCKFSKLLRLERWLRSRRNG